MGYVGQAPGKVVLSSGDITDGIIINADIASDAAIVISKTALSAGTGITLSTNTLNIDASQTQITSVGALNAGSITSGFTSIDVGAGAITTTGALSIASMGTNWTNAGRTVADMGSVTTIDINGGTINGITDLAVADGGTGASTATAGFDALAPMTAEGDIIYGGTSGTGTRLAKGSNTQVLTLASGVPSWASPAAGYSDAEAITAVEGESTLVLQSGATIGGSVAATVSNKLSAFAATTSAELAGVISNETGSGALVFATSPTLVTPALGTPASGVLTNATGYTGDTALVTTGALNAGSITSGFTSVDVGSGGLTTTGAIAGGTIDASTDFTIGGTVITDNTITDDGTLVIAASTATSFSDGNITNVGNIALDSISADATDMSIAVTDNSATALTVLQGTDAYLIVDTANGSESVSIGTGISGTAIAIGHGTSETTFGDNVTITGDLTINGAQVTNATTNLTVADPLVKYGQAYVGSAYDQGFIVTRGNGSASNTQNMGFIWDESADEFATIKAATEDGATAGNVTVTDYVNLHVGAITADDTSVFSGSIELGHASDTTIARSGAGALTVEGTAVLLAGDALTGTTIDATTDFTIGGTVITDGALADGAFTLNSDVFVANGKSLVIGHDAVLGAAFTDPEFQVLGTTAKDASILIAAFSATVVPRLILARDESGGAIGSYSGGLLDDGDEVGRIVWSPSDGVDMDSIAAEIVVEMDGTSASNDSPGRLVFKTTPDGTAVTTEALRLDSAQNATFAGSISAATGSTIGNLTLANGSITDSSGAITFVNENLVTTGTLGAGATTVTSLSATDGNITNVGDIALDSITADDGSTITVNDNTYLTAGLDLIVGHTSAIAGRLVGGGVQAVGQNSSDNFLTARFSASTAGANLEFVKSRHATIGSNTIVQSGDDLGTITFSGADGVDFASRAASIAAQVDGTPGAGDMPGRLVFSTTADGAQDPTLALTLDSSQNATFAGDVEIADSKFIEFASAAGTPTTDNKVQGIVIEFLAAEAITQFDAVYVSTTTGRVGRADANVASMAKMPVIGIAIEAQGTAGSSVRVLTHGVYRDDGGFGGNMTVGVPLYAPEAPGTLTTTAPSDDGDFVQKVGVSIGVRSVFINPSLDVIEHA